MNALGPSPIAAGERQLRVDEARTAILAAIENGTRPALEPQRVLLAEAGGRVLAEDVVSPIDVPAHDNSAMDGFAFAGNALRDDSALALQVAGTVLAGQPWRGRPGVGQCLRIMTGAVMPDGCDTVVPLELVREGDGEGIRVPRGAVQAGDNRRRRGEDLARGGVALQRGRVLRPSDLGLAASLGCTALAVRRKLRVALFSTGDELRQPGEPLPPACIYDSNRESLRGALQRLPVEVVDLGLVRDDPGVLEATLQAALARADAVLTSGGVSMGDADHTRGVLARCGRVDFWKVAMRPGRPFAFGPLQSGDSSALLFALPGNPVAALVTFHAFVREALLRLAGATPPPVHAVPLPCAVPIRKRPGRTEFQRARVERDATGRLTVRPSGNQGAGILRSMSEADALIVLEHDRGPVAAGEPVEVWLFDGLV